MFSKKKKSTDKGVEERAQSEHVPLSKRGNHAMYAPSHFSDKISFAITIKFELY